MDIVVIKNYLSIKPFKIEGLPDFVVLTGENGTGKTQLLDYLYASSQDMNPDIMDIDYSKLPPNDFTPEGIAKYSAEILVDGKHINNIIYRPVQTPNIDLGNDFNYNQLIDEGDRLTFAYISYRKYKDIFPSSNVDTQRLTQIYQSKLGIKKSSNSYENKNIKFPTISKNDIAFFELIEKKYGDFDPLLITYYYIINHQLIQTDPFSLNLKYLYVQYWAKYKAGLELGIAPWESFNKVVETAGFRYILDAPDWKNKDFIIKLRDRIDGTIIDANSLSSGEKVIFSLVLAMYTSSSSPHPDAILFDEPDAYLHPSLSKKLLDVIENVLVKEYGIKVIMTSHSPSTIALAPEESIYVMDREKGEIMKSTKQESILKLTNGLKTLSVFYERSKQVIVEASIDKEWYTTIYETLKRREFLDNDMPIINFLNLGNDKENGGCDKLIQIVNDLRNAGNNTIYGLTDWDLDKKESPYIKVLGKANRYSIENYAYDPIAIMLITLNDQYNQQIIGLDINDDIKSIDSITQDKVQIVVDKVLSLIETEINSKELNKEFVKCLLLNKMEINLPVWFLRYNGHQLENIIKKTFPIIFNKHNHPIEFFKFTYKIHPEFLPKEILDTINSLEQA